MARDYSRFLPSLTGGTGLAPTGLERLGWHPSSPSRSASTNSLDAACPRHLGERSGLNVEGEGLPRGAVPPRTDATVGDWLLYDAARPGASRLFDRKSRRAAGTGRDVQLIAANVDTVFVVTSCNRDFNVARLERYVALAFEADVEPVIVATKADLAEDPGQFALAATEVSASVPVVVLDALGPEPRDKLKAPVQGRAAPSPSSDPRASASRRWSTRCPAGPRRRPAAFARTTTGGGTPPPGGTSTYCRELCGARHAGHARAAAHRRRRRHFRGVRRSRRPSARCRFSDCRHEDEPGCAVQAAIASGEIDEARLRRWQKLQREEAFNSASLAERRERERSSRPDGALDPEGQAGEAMRRAAAPAGGSGRSARRRLPRLASSATIAPQIRTKAR